MAAINRGDIFDADLPGIGRRPVLVVSRQQAIYHSTTVVVAAVTGRIRDRPGEVALGTEHGLQRASVADCNELYTVPKGALSRRRRGSLEVSTLLELDRALMTALGIGSFPGAL